MEIASGEWKRSSENPTFMRQGSPLPQHPWNKHRRVIVFDGVCNFCHAFVNFVLKQDPHGDFKFGTLQSSPAQEILKHYQLPVSAYETFLFIEEGMLFTKSTAALRILKQLGIPWSIFWVFVVIPRPIRDLIYDCVARHRYQWMGKSKTCRVPSKEESGRFVS